LGIQTAIAFLAQLNADVLANWGHGLCPPISLGSNQSLGEIVHCIELFEAALGGHTMREAIGLFMQG
jgi:hypothetical protein